MLTVGDVVAAMQRRYPPAWAEEWDAVGLVCGDPRALVQRVLLAVDPAPSVVDEAIDWGADLLLTHHPLLLRGVHSVATTSAKGRTLHRLIRNDVALFAAHTNADNARPGVSDALANALGLRDLEPLVAQTEGLDKIITFVPHADADRLLDALAEAGAGRIGDYERCGYLLEGTGTFRPLAGASPTIGSVGDVERVPETRLEMVLPSDCRPDVVAALRAAHPYEEPAFDVVELAPFDARRGLGRVGVLPAAESLDDFAARVAAALPSTVGGVQVAGDPAIPVTRVAVCGGAGDSLLGAAARSDVDVFVTADLRYHPASEAMEAGGPALVNVSHWASEWPWLAQAAQLLADDLAEGYASDGGLSLTLRISDLCTDPWTILAESEPADTEAAQV